MKTLFELTPFSRPAFSPRLGSWFSDIWSEVKDIAPDVTSAWKGYTEAEKAEEERKAAEANAAATAARAQATPAAAPAAAGGGLLGIPTGYLVVGGLALVGVGLLVFMSRK